MRHTIIIALLLITLFPNTALAQWGFDAVSVEAYINDHKKQRSLLLARSTLEYSTINCCMNTAVKRWANTRN